MYRLAATYHLHRDALASRLRLLASRAYRDRGEGPIQWVVIVAIGVAIAVAVGGILMIKARAKANNLDTTTP
jgi:hypothetical protein